MRQTVQHSLAPERAKDVLARALEAYRQHYPEHSIETAWLDERTAEVGFHLTGRKVGGRIAVCPDCFDIDIDLPWVLLPFRRRIATALDEELQRWLRYG